jgi:hypothetical protein
MWAKASISSPSELAREAGEAQPVGNADRPHIPQTEALYGVLDRALSSGEFGQRSA